MIIIIRIFPKIKHKDIITKSSNTFFVIIKYKNIYMKNEDSNCRVVIIKRKDAFKQNEKIIYVDDGYSICDRSCWV